MRRFEESGLTTADPPIVGRTTILPIRILNRHQRTRGHSSQATRAHRYVAKFKKPGAIYYDITWLDTSASLHQKQYQEIFDIVKMPATLRLRCEGSVCEREHLLRVEVDDACRNVVKKAGYGKYFVHRTGHSIG